MKYVNFMFYLGYHLTTPFIWRITDYSSKKANNTEIYSDPFYTSEYGYKLKVYGYNYYYKCHSDKLLS